MCNPTKAVPPSVRFRPALRNYAFHITAFINHYIAVLRGKNGGTVSEEEKQSVGMAECGACRAVIPIDSESCPECGTQFSGVSEDQLGECGACNALVPLDSTRCPSCGVLFVADDVVDVLRQWVADTGINIRKLFDKFDENNDGTIDSAELKRGLLSLNLADLPPSQIDRLVAQIDEDDNGVIDLDEFDAILAGDDVETPAKDATLEDGDDAAETEEVEADENVSETDEVEADEDVLEAEGGEMDAQEGDEESVETEAEEVPDEADDDGEETGDETAEEASDDADIEDDMDDEEFELEEEEETESTGTRHNHPLAALAEMMEAHDVSAQRMFNDLDTDGNGMISLAELSSLLENDYSDQLDIADVQSIMDGVDGDGDGMIDITEFIESIEEYETFETLVEEKVFPTAMQKRMMSKSWNDSVWPILHVAFGILIAVFIANGMFGFVDGSGGNIAYEPNDSGLIPSGDVQAGDIYPCDEKFQKDGCRNSLTPFAGTNGSTSMPMGFYWDGLALIGLSAIGLISSLFLHLVKAPEWRARLKAMKEFEDDKSDASDDAQDAELDEEDAAMEDDADDEEFIEEDHEEDDEDDDIDEEMDDDAIDVGSHIGLTFEDEEVFGTILEFDDDEGTVTIEEDGTGDLVTGYQEDMFIE